MKKTVLACIFLSGLLASCSGSKEDNDGQISQELRLLEGGRYAGGIFNMSEPDYIKNLFPLSIVDIYSYRVATQIYEGLFKFDQTSLEIIPSLAESYQVDDSKTVYTFKLRKGVFFHEDACFADGKGRELKAEDVAYCFRRICSAMPENHSFYLFENIVKGANEYHTKAAAGQEPATLESIKVIDDYTVQVTLEHPSSLFLYNLCRPGAFIYPKEAFDAYGQDMREKCVGTGPFTLSSLDEGISIILKKNPRYYKKDEYDNQLPYLDVLNIRFIKDKNVEFHEFKKGTLDMMYRLPTDHIIEILEEAVKDSDGGISQYDLQRAPEMSTQLLTLNNESTVFKDVNVRKALSFAIDREHILTRVLNGEGFEHGKYGITPPSFPNYDVTKIKGYEFNRDSANYYMQKAGYKNGNGFPKLTIDLNSEGARYINVALEIQKQLKTNLGIEVELNTAPLAKVAEKSMNGDFQILRHAWIADYPSPENFLWFLTSQSLSQKAGEAAYPDISRYKNPKFDELYQKAITATTQEDAMRYFMEAEQLMMKEAPIIILWYDEGFRIVKSYVKNFPNNPMQYRDFTEVYLTPKKASAGE